MIGVYIHIPFCRHKCFYCDFHSVAGREELVGEYVKAVGKEIEARAEAVGGREVASIFFGGGTPSLLAPEQAERILKTLRGNMRFGANIEITMEMNPESVTKDKLTAYRAVGVNRASVGVQSLNKERLKFLQRIHSADEAQRAVETAFNAGFDNVSADFMYSLPGQTIDEWTAELNEAAGWGLTHISCYELTPEEATPLGKAVDAGNVELADSGATFFDATEETLKNAGFTHYEISNYARPEQECVHNIGYWEYRDYLGIGAGAHGFMRGERWENLRDIEKYIASVSGKGTAEMRRETITQDMALSERLMLGLRMKDGIVFDASGINAGMKKMMYDGLLTYSNGRLKCSAKGLRLLDSVLAGL